MQKLNKSKRELLAETKANLASAGYLSIVQPNPKDNINCDLLAYAPGPGGFALGTAVAIMSESVLDLELEAMRLDWIRTRAGLENALLVTSAGTYTLLPDGKNLVSLDILPQVTASADPIRDLKLVNNLLWDLVNETRGLIEPANFPSWLLDQIKVENALVQLREGGPLIDGAIFRTAFTGLVARNSARNFSELASSSSIQFLFGELASLFPNARSIFDPFFGSGLTTYSVIDSLRGALTEKDSRFTATGSDINSVAIRAAMTLSNSVLNLEAVHVHQEESTSLNWPEHDLLVTTPPMGMRLGEPLVLEGVNVKHIEHFAILKAAHEVSRGRMAAGAIILTSRSWLTRNDCQDLRDKLIDLNVVKAILGVPDLHMSSSMPLSAIVLRSNPGEIVMGELMEDWKDVIAGKEGGLYELLRK